MYKMAAIVLFATATFALPAQARPLHHHKTQHHIARSEGVIVCDRQGCRSSTATPERRIASGRKGNCPRNLGCGCNLANYFHIGGQRWRELWVARAWAREGTRASKGCIGCVAVLSRGRRGGHVGVVQAYDANGNPVVYSYANGRLGWTTAAYPSQRVIAYRSL